MVSTVTLSYERCASIFTQLQLISAAASLASSPRAAVAKTSGRADNIHWRASYEAPSPAACALPEASSTPLARLESPGAAQSLQAIRAESPPTSLLRSHSVKWQIPGIPYPSHRGCEQKQGSQAVIGPTSADHFPASIRSCRPLHSAQPSTLRSTSWAKLLEKIRRNPPASRRFGVSLPTIPLQSGDFPMLCSSFIRLSHNNASSSTRLRSASFCYTWVILLHFSLTTDSFLSYDFLILAL
jgi:hypothetical protein